MSDRLHEHIFHEIAMSLGNSLDMRRMLGQGLTTYLRRLGCLAGSVLESVPNEAGGMDFRMVFGVPRCRTSPPSLTALTRFIPKGSDEAGTNAFLADLPLAARDGDNNLYLFDLPEFGLLGLVKNGEPFAESVVKSLLPINRKLANACISCRSNEQVEEGNTRLEQEIEERRQAEKRYRSIFENAVEGIFRSALDGRVLEVNPAMLRIFGYESMEEVVTRVRDLSHDFYLHPEDRDRLLGMLKEQGHVAHFEVQCVRKDGTTVWVSISARIIRDDQGTPQHIEGICEDITERVAARHALQQAKEKAEELNRTKTVFLSTVSHELRTPLTSILGFSQVIRKRLTNRVRPALSDDRALETLDTMLANVDIMVTEGRRLTQLINDVLDLTRLEAGRMEWRMGGVDMAEVLDHCLTTMAVMAEEKGLRLEMDCAPDIPMVQGDRDRLIQVCLNLLGNAIKFTDKGGVCVSAVPDLNMLRVSVADTGSGIATEDLEAVFDSFRQLGGDITGKPEGTGLGLPICREIITHHGGRIWAMGEPGVGSTFGFSLPIPARETTGETTGGNLGN